MRKRITSAFLSFFLTTGYVFSASVETGEAVARIYGHTIYRSDLNAKGTSLKPLLMRPLYEHFVKRNHIVVSESEINEFLSAMGNTVHSAESSEQREIMHEMAKASVLDWKVSKVLYKQYGGDVIFQQANPLEPIGAERRFLEEQEKSGAFQIFDSQERKKFFDYYIQPQPMVIPPSKVNYERPWWRK